MHKNLIDLFNDIEIINNQINKQIDNSLNEKEKIISFVDDILNYIDDIRQELLIKG